MSRLLALLMTWRRPGRNASGLTACLPQGRSSGSWWGVLRAVPYPSETHRASPRGCRTPPAHAKQLWGRRPSHQGRSWGGTDAAAGSPRGLGQGFPLDPRLNGGQPCAGRGGCVGKGPPCGAKHPGSHLLLSGGGATEWTGVGGYHKSSVEELVLMTGAWRCRGLRGGELHLHCLGWGRSGNQMEEDRAWGCPWWPSQAARRDGRGTQWGPQGRAGGPTLSSDHQCPHAALSWVPWATVSSISQDRTASLHL